MLTPMGGWVWCTCLGCSGQHSWQDLSWSVDCIMRGPGPSLAWSWEKGSIKPREHRSQETLTLGIWGTEELRKVVLSYLRSTPTEEIPTVNKKDTHLVPKILIWWYKHERNTNLSYPGTNRGLHQLVYLQLLKPQESNPENISDCTPNIPESLNISSFSAVTVTIGQEHCPPSRDVTHLCTPLLHMMMWQAPSLSHSSEETDSRPTPEAPQGVFTQAAMRLDLINEVTSR